MIIEPGLLTHMKLLRLKKRLGAEHGCRALEYLLALWAHCQEDKRGENWGAVEADYVEDICGWQGSAGLLYDALTAVLVIGKRPWITRDEAGNLIITGWYERNAGMVANWRRNPVGSNGRSVGGSAGGSADMSAGVSAAPPTGQDRTGHDKRGNGGGGLLVLSAAPEPGGDALKSPPLPKQKRGAALPEIPKFEELPEKLFDRELKSRLKTTKELRDKALKHPALRARCLTEAAKSLAATLEQEGKPERAQAVLAAHDSYSEELTLEGKAIDAVYRQRIHQIEARLLGQSI